ncbi:MAG: AAA family ATPase, partial [Candidatus Methanomethylophilaceae archaeon]|nr:AAA family ATPase [Candidatus Methanomethylophilaceae archaeon]
MIFERKVLSQLKQWKENSKGRSAILLDGAHGVGKTTIAKVFAESNYRSYILIDFTTNPDSMKNIFVKYRDDLDLFFNMLQLKTGITLYERDSLLIFDEVQQFPLAREMIRELVGDGRYDYLETGSLISLKSNVRNIRIPSEEHTICVHPMDFEEWLLAIGQEVTANILRKHCETLEPLGEDTHEVIMRKYREY